MSLYDNGGVSRSKPPRSTQMQQPPPSSTVIVSIVPNEQNTLREIACIVLSADYLEKESFSFTFRASHECFRERSQFVFNALHNAQWVVTEQYDVVQVVHNAFQAVSQASPQPLHLLSATQYFQYYQRDYHQRHALCARAECGNLYDTIISIALSNAFNTTPTIVTTKKMDMVAQNTFASSYGSAVSYPDETVSISVSTDYANINNNNSNVADKSRATYHAPPINSGASQAVQTTATAASFHDGVSASHYNGFHDDHALSSAADAMLPSSPPLPQQARPRPRSQLQPQPQLQPQQVEETVVKEEQAQVAEDEQRRAHARDDELDLELNVAHEEEEEEAEQNALVMPSSVPQDGNEQSSSMHMETASTPSDQCMDVPQASASSASSSSSGAVVSALSTRSSWAAKFATTQSSPKRALVAVNMSEAAYRGQKGKFAAAKSTEAIRARINDAISKKRLIWVCYNGHQKPFLPRGIQPIQWDTRNKQNGVSFFAIQHRSIKQNQQRFYLKNVLEVRDQQWKLSNAQLDALKKRYQGSSANYFGGGGNFNVFSHETRAASERRGSAKKTKTYPKDSNQEQQQTPNVAPSST
mmetsp:Transcript_28279/g.46479  ORF Transcript_28279/g.46479 Transcript_28279/m.46479 type:complete len:586 (-) Transcript_28279:70-1827(-)